MIKKSFFLLNLIFTCFFLTSASSTELQKNLINKFTGIKTLSFNFNQKISEKEEKGNCFIKYPLLMKCNYQNLKQKTIISNGKTVAIIKKKYKKIYYYPIKTTPLFFILQKEKIMNLIRKNQPEEVNSKLVKFQFIDKKNNNIQIFFDKNSLEFKGWKTLDAYSNEVNFAISNLKINTKIADKFFRIPEEKDL